jgi:hypothetical protein
MAVAMDRSLPSGGQSPLRTAGGGSAAIPRGPRMDDRRVARQSNNLYAQSGGREMTLRGMDRAGISRGKGQRLQADMAGAAQDSSSRAAAMNNEMGAGQANVGASQQYDAMRNSERMASEGLLQNLRDSQRREQTARRSAGMDNYETQMRGQFNLDSMQLDYTPLLRQLFS